MKLDPKYRLEKIASRDQTRRLLAQPYLDVEKKRLAATNGHALAVVPVTISDGDRTGAIPSAAVAAARRAPVKARKRIAACGEVMYVRPSVNFPDIDAVIPKYRAGDEKTVSIGLSHRLLMDLVAAIGAANSPGVILTVPLPPDAGCHTDAIVVSNYDNDEAIGVLMPIPWSR